MINRTRLAALSLPILTCAAMVIVQSVAFPAQVGAAQCSQACYAQQGACYEECDNTDHSINDDSFSTCYSDCDRELDPCFYWAYECEYPEEHCYAWSVWDTYWCSDYPTCAPANRYLLDHDFNMYEASSSWCW